MKMDWHKKLNAIKSADNEWKHLKGKNYDAKKVLEMRILNKKDKRTQVQLQTHIDSDSI